MPPVQAVHHLAVGGRAVAGPSQRPAEEGDDGGPVGGGGGQPQPAVQVELGQEDEGERGTVGVRQVDDPAVDGDDLAAVGDVRGEVGGEERGQVGASVVNKAKILEKDRRKF